MHAGDPDAQRVLRAALSATSLLEAWETLLRARGLDFPLLEEAAPPAVREDVMNRRMTSLLKVYDDRNRLYDLYILAEALIEYDENFLLWRNHHILMVERMIGMKHGTGGSEGVGYLRTTLGRKCFPDLWEVRTHISRGGVYGQQPE